MPRALLVEILGEAKQFAKELDHAAGKTRQLSKVAGVAGLAIAGGLAVGLDKSVEAAVKGQASQANLDQALRNTHQSVAAMKAPLEDAEAASRKLGFADDDTRAALAKLEIATGSTKDAVKDLSVAQDLARFKHISLEAATKTLTMAQTGSQRALKQLGLTVAPVTVAQDKLKLAYHAQLAALKAQEKGLKNETVAQKEHFAELKRNIDNTYAADKAVAKLSDTQATAGKVVQQVSEHLHGQADAFSGTAAGGMATFHAQTEHVEETLGTALLPALGEVSGSLAKLGTFMSNHAETAKILVGALAAVAGTLITISAATKIWEGAQKLAAAASKIWTAGQWLLNAALDANPIGLVVIAIAALVAAFVVAYRTSGTFRDIVKGAFDDVKTVAEDIAGFFTRDIPGAFNAAVDWVRSNWPEIVTLISGPFAPLVALATGAFGIRAAIVGAFDTVKTDVVGKVGAVVTAILDGFAGIGGKAWDVINNIGSFIDTKAAEIAGWGTGVANKVKNAVVNTLVGIGSDAWNVVNNIGSFIEQQAKDITGWGGSIANKIKSAVSSTLTGIGTDAWNVITGIGTTITDKVTDITEFGAHVGRVLKSGFLGALTGIGKAALTVIAGAFNVVLGQINNLIGQINDALSFTINTHIPGVGKIHVDAPNIPTLPLVTLAAGGIVTGPTLALLGESGREAVIPLDRGGAAGGVTVNVTVNGWVGNDQDLSARIVGAFAQANRSGHILLADMR